MYVPSYFCPPDQQALINLIRNNSFGVMITPTDSGQVATHLPFLLEQNDSGFFLKGHFAKANNHWQKIADKESLIIFQGAHCYISPNWYASPQVPTWNYTAAHIYGTTEILNARDDKHNIVLELSDIHEKTLPDPWIPDYDDALLDAIVGFKFVVSRAEGKYKLSQNKTEQDRRSAIKTLQSASSENEQAIAKLMHETL